MQQANYYNIQDELDEDISVDIRKLFYAVKSRMKLVIKIISCVMLFFIVLTFIMPKEYKVSADLYVNKTNNSNMAEINPYFIQEIGSASGGVAALMSGGSSGMLNELELIQSPLVIDKVIRENDLRFKKILGIIPTKNAGEYLTAEKFLKKGVDFDNKKGTNVISIEYKAKTPEIGYNVVNSIIINYIDLHKSLNSERAGKDRKIIEEEYKKAKTNLEKKANSAKGLPSSSVTGIGNLSAMSAFSKSASKAISSLTGQIVAGERTQLEVQEEAEKTAGLATRLEWAKLVEQLSDSSKVLILKEPQKLQSYEQDSPKLFVNIILGAMFGIIISIITVAILERNDKKLCYTMLGDNIIYRLKDGISDLKILLLTNQNVPLSVVTFENLPKALTGELKKFGNLTLQKAEISSGFVNSLANIKNAITIAAIGETDSKFYKQVKQMLEGMNIKILKEVIL